VNEQFIPADSRLPVPGRPFPRPERQSPEHESVHVGLGSGPTMQGSTPARGFSSSSMRGTLPRADGKAAGCRLSLMQSSLSLRARPAVCRTGRSNLHAYVLLRDEIASSPDTASGGAGPLAMTGIRFCRRLRCAPSA